jgi:hypothetical protein
MDLIGQRFGRLLVTARAPRPTTQRYYATRWECRCDCGNTKTVFASALRSKATQSCGCLQRAAASKNIRRALAVGSRGNLRHGKSADPEWVVWSHIKQRCFNIKDPAYINYGGRGIKVCDRWLIFENFIADVGVRPSALHTLERVDNNSHYCPENCRWATRKEQARNRRSNANLTLNGVTRTIAEWAELTGIKRSAIWMRIHRYHWSTEDALTKK